MSGATYAIGIMSGTSADGVDAALTRIEIGRLRSRSTLVSLASRPYSDALRRQVLEAQEGTLGLRDALALSVKLTEVACDAALAALSSPQARGIRPEVAGFHGQTVFHDPRGARSGARLTVQIGEPSILARGLGCPVVSSFRMADILAGGEGAPLVPRFDWNQFASEDRDRVLLNLGGISNLTRLPAGGGVEVLVAFDCGPGNMLLDGLMAGGSAGSTAGGAGARYDDGGKLAATGRADEAVVRGFLADPFIEKAPPKSAGREEFGRAYLERFLSRTSRLSLADRLRTAAAITAGAVARGIALSGPGSPDEVIVSGGGAKNATVLEELRVRLGARVAVGTTDAHGVPVEAKEAMAFAFLAHETISGRPGNVPAATGATAEVILGSVTPPPAPRR
jgi:anhydro-N-acetylmuramic acid kinase